MVQSIKHDLGYLNYGLTIGSYVYLGIMQYLVKMDIETLEFVGKIDFNK